MILSRFVVDEVEQLVAVELDLAVPLSLIGLFTGGALGRHRPVTVHDSETEPRFVHSRRVTHVEKRISGAGTVLLYPMRFQRRRALVDGKVVRRAYLDRSLLGVGERRERVRTSGSSN